MRILFINLFLLIISSSFSQQKFVEVTVNDSVWAKPDWYIYRVNIVKSDYSMDSTSPAVSMVSQYSELFPQSKLSNRALKDSLEFIIKQKGFYVLPATIKEKFEYNNRFEDFKPYHIDIMTGSADSLKLLFDLVSKQNDISGVLIKVFSKDESGYTRILNKKLLASAQNKAIQLASFGKQKIGAIISITEKNDLANEDWTIYPPLSALRDSQVPGWHTSNFGYSSIIAGNEQSCYYVISSSLIVRYSLE